MTRAARIASAAVVDARGVAGSTGAAFTWSDLGIDPLARACGWPRAFSPDCEKFRRMDVISRSVLLAAEAAGLNAGGVLVPAVRANTALVSAGAFGCLDSDVRFARGLMPDAEIEPAVFSYTLSSTSLGELAIRHGLNGPCYAFSTAPGTEGEALLEARALVENQEAAAAVVCLGDAVTEAAARGAGIQRRWLVAALVVVCEPDVPAWLSWDDVGRPDLLESIADRLWRRGSCA